MALSYTWVQVFQNLTLPKPINLNWGIFTGYVF